MGVLLLTDSAIETGVSELAGGDSPWKQGRTEINNQAGVVTITVILIVTTTEIVIQGCRHRHSKPAIA